MLELADRDIDRHAERFLGGMVTLPVSRLLASAIENPMAESQYRPRFLGEGDELKRLDCAACRAWGA